MEQTGKKIRKLQTDVVSTQLQKTEHSTSPLSFYMPMSLPLPLAMLLQVLPFVPEGFSHILSTPLKKSNEFCWFCEYRVKPTLFFPVPYKLYTWPSTAINQLSSNENKLIVCFCEHDVGPNEGQHERTRGMGISYLPCSDIGIAGIDHVESLRREDWHQ